MLHKYTQNACLILVRLQLVKSDDSQTHIACTKRGCAYIWRSPKTLVLVQVLSNPEVAKRVKYVRDILAQLVSTL